jgi:phage RecT family recombinase
MKEISVIDQVKKKIMASEEAFAAVLPKNFDVKKFIATFCLEVQKNPKLAQCPNLIEVARDVANFGLVIGGLANQAYLIPYQNYKTKEYSAQLIIGYKGYITKLEEAGYSVEAEIVTNQEIKEGRFEEKRGSETKITHSPIRSGIRGREDVALAYCVIKSKDNSFVISVLSKEEIEEMAKTEKWVENNGKKSKERSLGNVWTQNQRATDFGQMCIKTVIRNAIKRVNLKIANEMSVYEGQRDQEIESIKDITPSKTAQAHAAVETAFAEKQPAIEQEINMESSLISAINSLTSTAAIDKFLEKNSDYKAMEESDPETFATIFEAAENRKASIQMGG